jgi:hypothetical protein
MPEKMAHLPHQHATSTLLQQSLHGRAHPPPASRYSKIEGIYTSKLYNTKANENQNFVEFASGHTSTQLLDLRLAHIKNPFENKMQRIFCCNTQCIKEYNEFWKGLENDTKFKNHPKF